MEKCLFLSIGVILFCSTCFALTPSTYITSVDIARLKNVFSSSLPPPDLISAHYAVLGFSLLGEKVPDSQGICKFVNEKMEKQLDSIFHASSATALLGNCKITMSGLQQFLESSLTAEAPMQDIYHTVISMKNLNLNVDSPKVSKLLSSALKKDDSVLNLGYAFHVASKLQGDLMPFFERIEDVIVQADEVDGKYLQFEGGLGITATTISGVYRLAEAFKKAPALTPDQAVKFTNYFLSRKFVQTVKGVAQLLDILNILSSSNKFHVPTSMTLASSSAVSVQNPNVLVRITDVLGKPLGPMSVTADSVIRLSDNSVVLSKKPFTLQQGSNSVYSLNLVQNTLLRGFYKLVLSAVPSKPDTRLVGNTAAQVNVKVMTEVNIDGIEIGVVDRDQATSTKPISVSYPNKLSSVLEADFHQKVLLKFALKDKNAKTTMLVHQAFVQFIHPTSNQEVVFVAEPDSSNTYRFDLDVQAKAKDFNYGSVVYDVSLIVGDAVVSNPFTWKLGQLHLTFPPNPQTAKTVENPYKPKPEIKHLFREQEKRPSTLVSNTFSVLVCLPLFLLFILWFKIGANMSNFSFSLSALGFHSGLAAIFLLFACFWVHLNMFRTLKYLSGIGLVTFLCGHSLLKRIGQSRKI